MQDLTSILKNHQLKKKKDNSSSEDSTNASANNHENRSSRIDYIELPDIFFDRILPEFKINRIEVLVLLSLYRKVWGSNNPHREFGISEILSLEKFYTELSITRDELYNAITKLEHLGLVETIRSGQYFIRRFFIKELDEKFGQSYDNFF